MRKIDQNRRMTITDQTTPRPSNISIPPRATPMCKLVFFLMREQAVTYSQLEHYSGVLASTVKSWRSEKSASLTSLQAALGALGWGIAPHPRLESLPPHVREMAEELGQHFFSDDIALATAVAAASSNPGARGTSDVRAPRLEYRSPIRIAEAA